MAKIRFTHEQLTGLFPEVDQVDFLPRKKKKALKKKIVKELKSLIDQVITKDFGSK
jgi:hypothetical protein